MYREAKQPTFETFILDFVVFIAVYDGFWGGLDLATAVSEVFVPQNWVTHVLEQRQVVDGVVIVGVLPTTKKVNKGKA